ncbi:sulfatase-like hydrolase/transferase [Flavivirga abyssicola]|uniref:sulfatase-like hydrolase/transferase n=1 Tax=Flavivirga abyssicola TaxID=3063533 RepID=UPI0026DEF46F|nr:sulfatase-like hydrolase/transferase [Flavivirga sp. MEBiC07777]WVK11978.1 sulfatase-like hydrolase/transferase [Flavivirga sp. MEBiC07777]
MKNALLILLFSFLIYGVNAQSNFNIVLIESDDQSNQAIGAYDNPSMVTPNMDTLAKEGVSFTSAYNMGCWSPAVCVPSRTMLFYGQYLWDSRKITKENAPISLPEILKKQGYNTYMTGKWHVWGNKPKDIFDQTGTILPGQLKTYYKKEGHATDIVGNEAAQYIKEYNSDKPFFVYAAFNAPHVPRETEQKYYDLYPVNKMELPPSVINNSPLNPNIKYNYTKAPIKAEIMKSRVQQNNAMVTHMDERIGDILNALKEKGVYDNTIIVFMSDHGISFGENGVAGKVCLYEPSVTAPLIIKAPGITANKKIEDRVYLQDILPTLLELVDVKTDADFDFQSLTPLINKTDQARASIYLAMFDDQRGVISNNKKLIIYPKSNDIELYDFKIDPWETTNLIDTKKGKKEFKQLHKELMIWQENVGDTVNLKSIKY